MLIFMASLHRTALGGGCLTAYLANGSGSGGGSCYEDNVGGVLGYDNDPLSSGSLAGVDFSSPSMKYV